MPTYDLVAMKTEMSIKQENAKFIEPEALAPMTRTASGAATTHVESWNLHKVMERRQSKNKVQVFLQSG